MFIGAGGKREERRTRKKWQGAEKLSLLLEAERTRAADICRREGIAPALFSRWRAALLRAGLAALQAKKRGPKGQREGENKL